MLHRRPAALVSTVLVLATALGLTSACSRPGDAATEAVPSSSASAAANASDAAASEDPEAPTEAAEPSVDPEDEVMAADAEVVRGLLAARSAAVVDGDRRAFLSMLTTGARPAEKVVYANMQRLGIADMSYSIFDYVTREQDGRRTFLDAEGVEDVQIRGAESAPVSYPVRIRVVEQDGEWRVRRVVRFKQALQSVRDTGVKRLWARDPIEVARRGPSVAVVDRDGPIAADDLLTLLLRSFREVQDAIGVKPDRRIIIDATTHGTSRRIGVSREDEAAAFAVQTTRRSPLGSVLEDRVSVRVQYNPQLVEDLGASFVLDPSIVRHEVVHAVVRDLDIPRTLEEGIASLVEDSFSFSEVNLDGDVVADVRAHFPRRRIAPDRVFFTHPTAGYMLGHAIAVVAEQRGVLDDLVTAFPQRPEEYYDGLVEKERTRVIRRAFRRSSGEDIADIIEGGHDLVASRPTF